MFIVFHFSLLFFMFHYLSLFVHCFSLLLIMFISLFSSIFHYFSLFVHCCFHYFFIIFIVFHYFLCCFHCFWLFFIVFPSICHYFPCFFHCFFHCFSLIRLKNTKTDMIEYVRAPGVTWLQIIYLEAFHCVEMLVCWFSKYVKIYILYRDGHTNTLTTRQFVWKHGCCCHGTGYAAREIEL